MEMNKARNLIEHEEEIFSRPPRVWFQSKADLKRKSGKKSVRGFLFVVLTVITPLLHSVLSSFSENAVNGPAAKKSKNRKEKGKTAGIDKENVRMLSFFRLNIFC